MRKVELKMNEQEKYETIKRLVETNGNKKYAAVKLGLSLRQVNRLIQVYGTKGKEGFVHGNRGRIPATAVPDNIRSTIVDLYRLKYSDANFLHFTELLKKNEDISLSASTVTSILEAEGIYSPRITRAKKKRVKKELEAKKENASGEKEKRRIQSNLVALEDAHSRRPRSAYFGEEIQMDASPFVWFGNETTSLHLAIDDNTGRAVGAWFDKEETLRGYYNVYHQILTTYGIPCKFKTDRRTVFTYKSKASPSVDEDTYTQFAYACKRLGTSIESSSTPQFKPRVERAFETMQSRLPVEMRLAGVTTLDEANEFLTSYLEEFNEKFSLPINNSKSAFEKQPENEQINLILSVLSPRKVDAGHCVRFRNRYYRMLDSRGMQQHYLKGTEVMVAEAFDGNRYCCVNDEDVYALEEIPAIMEKSPELDSDYVQPKPKKQYIPPMSHPWKKASFNAFVARQAHHKNYDYAG